MKLVVYLQHLKMFLLSMGIKRNNYNMCYNSLAFKWLQRITLIFVVFFISSFTFTALADDCIKQYYDRENIVIAGDDQNFTVSGNEYVRITAGQSVVLLPGTHLVAGAKVHVEVIPEVRPEETDETNSFMKNPELKASPYIYEKTSEFASSSDKQIIDIAGNSLLAVFPTVNHYSGSKLPTGLRISYMTENLLNQSITLTGYLPVLSFGARPETIMVMRT